MAIDAQGSMLEINTGTDVSPTWTEINGIVSYSGLDGEASEIDVTNLKSPAKEFKLGLKDFGSFTAEIHPDYDDAGQDALRSAGSATKQFRITLPTDTPTVISFDGLVKNADSISGAVDGVVTGSVNIKITGLPVES